MLRARNCGKPEIENYITWQKFLSQTTEYAGLFGEMYIFKPKIPLYMKQLFETVKYVAFDADDTLWVNEPYFRIAE